jgi:hypothetical protein
VRTPPVAPVEIVVHRQHLLEGESTPAPWGWFLCCPRRFRPCPASTPLGQDRRVHGGLETVNSAT